MKTKTYLVRAILFLVGTLVAVVVGLGASYSYGLLDGVIRRNPQELVRHVKKRLQGHDKLEFVLLPILNFAQSRIERAPDAHALPRLGKGFSVDAGMRGGPPASRLVGSSNEVIQALLEAKAGTVIEIAPGTYPFKLKMRIRQGGEPGNPIVVRARTPGSVIFEFSQVEGILIDQPHWTFENLHIRGVCKSDDDCEHAFHIVGNAHHTIIRNNLIEDFNAQIKVNGVADTWPDHGQITQNTLRNSRPRKTLRSVTPVDLVGVSKWTVADNLVANFIKSDGNKVSFGMFMKGGGEGGRIERNLVICSSRDISMPGVRVGISFGGGGTDPRLCRNDGCAAYEHRGGLASNNIVAHCNDVGLDANRSVMTTMAHNTLINTAGISVRRAPSNVHSVANQFEGKALARDGATLKSESDAPLNAADAFRSPDALNLAPKRPLKQVPLWSNVEHDFCGSRRQPTTVAGAVEPGSPCTKVE